MESEAETRQLQQVLMSDAATSPKRPLAESLDDEEKQGAAKRQKQPKEEEKIVNDVYLARCWEVGTEDGHVKIGKNGTLWLKSAFKFDVRFPTDKKDKHGTSANVPFGSFTFVTFNISVDTIECVIHAHSGVKYEEFTWNVGCRRFGTTCPRADMKVIDGDYVFSMSVTACKQFNWLSETACWIPRVAFGRGSHGNDPTVREPCYISSSLINDDGLPIAVHPYQVEFNAPALAVALRRAYTIDAQRVDGRVTWMLDAPSAAIQAFLKAVLTGDYTRWFYDVNGELLDAEFCESVMLLAEHWMTNPLDKGMRVTPLLYAMRATLPKYAKRCESSVDKARVFISAARFSMGYIEDAIGDALDKAADACMSDEETDDDDSK